MPLAEDADDVIIEGRPVPRIGRSKLDAEGIDKLDGKPGLVARLTGQLSAARASLANAMASAACSLPRGAVPFWRGVASGVGTGGHLAFQKRVPGMNAACDLQFRAFRPSPPADFQPTALPSRTACHAPTSFRVWGPRRRVADSTRLADLERSRRLRSSRIARNLCNKRAPSNGHEREFGSHVVDDALGNLSLRRRRPSTARAFPCSGGMQGVRERRAVAVISTLKPNFASQPDHLDIKFR